MRNTRRARILAGHEVHVGVTETELPEADVVEVEAQVETEVEVEAVVANTSDKDLVNEPLESTEVPDEEDDSLE